MTGPAVVRVRAGRDPHPSDAAPELLPWDESVPGSVLEDFPPPVRAQPFDEDALLRAVARRLADAGSVLGVPVPAPVTDDPARDAAAQLELAVRAVQASGGEERVWLLLALAHGTLPMEEDVQRLRRRLELDDTPNAVRWLLEDRTWPAYGTSGLDSTLVQDQVVVDTGHTSTNDMITGIQRVVREVVRRWSVRPDVLPCAWTYGQGSLRTLTPGELARVSRWGEASDDVAKVSDTGPRLLLPWHTTVFLPEVPPESDRLARLRALTRYSGSRLVVLGYDVIPVTNCETVGAGLADVFAQYLGTVKYADRIIAISATAGREFEGFRRAVSAQGLPGPEIEVCLLPGDVPPGPAPVPAGDLPLVLCVGTLEPRKNHLAVLYAAELLWRRGLSFRLDLIGKVSGASEDVVERVEALQQLGRPVRIRRGVGDRDVWDAYREARLTVFVSLHEGFGLPVVESLTSGTPVVASDHGSTAEAAHGGGALLVDPTDEDAIAEAMARLLLDDDLHARLCQQARARRPRTWDRYAEELWEHVVRPAQPGAAGEDA